MEMIEFKLRILEEELVLGHPSGLICNHMNPCKIFTQRRHPKKGKENMSTELQTGVMWPQAKDCWAARASVGTRALPTH